MTDSWIIWMYFWSVVGAVAALFWPLLIDLWRKQVGGFYTLGSRGAMQRLSPFVKWVVKIVIVLVLGLAIGIIAAALGFAAFLGDPERQQSLQELGTLAYFSAVTYGFSAAALVSEPLKQPEGQIPGG